MPTPKLPEVKRAQVLDLHYKGMKGRDIAKLTKLSVGSVSNVIRDAGLQSHFAVNAKKKKEAVIQEAKAGGSLADIGKRAGACYSRARMILRELTDEKTKPEPVEYSLPEPTVRSYVPNVVDDPGQWLILCDVHIPEHDKTTIRLAIAEARRRKVVGVILNGDILDCHNLSDHNKDPRAQRYENEIKKGRQFIGWVRNQLKNARIIYVEGNHEARLGRYIFNRSPDIYGLEGVNIPSWLHLDDHGVEWVDGKRITHLGKLHLVHGHELGKGGGVNPARWLYLKARSVAMCGHFHRVSEHHARNIDMKYEAAWSVGCACHLNPYWLPINDWQHGFAFVHLERDGNFSVENKRVLNGRIV